MTSTLSAELSAPNGVRFEDLGLSAPLLRALKDQGYERPTLIQERAIPHVLGGADLLGTAQTGTGKTAAFVLPILQRMGPRAQNKQRALRVLILSPTRELATQIGKAVEVYGRHLDVRVAVVFGGISQHGQVRQLRAGVDVLVAAPGRLCDLLNQRLVDLSAIDTFVLDEADRMLDSGFWPSVRRIAELLPAQRQNLLFSATMPPELESFARRMLRNPVNVAVAPVASTPERIDQSLYFVNYAQKSDLLRHLLDDESVTRAVVFTRTKRGAERVAKHLAKSRCGAESIHGNKSQPARERALSRFKSGDVRVLVATDVAARGIDIQGISHVFNYDLPDDPESYVHRIGRTARAGALGKASSFCTAEQVALLRRIERLIGNRVPVVSNHPFAEMVDNAAPARDGASAGAGSRNGSGQRGFSARSAGNRSAAPARAGAHRSSGGASRPGTDRPSQSRADGDAQESRTARAPGPRRPGGPHSRGPQSGSRTQDSDQGQFRRMR